MATVPLLSSRLASLVLPSRYGRPFPACARTLVFAADRPSPQDADRALELDPTYVKGFYRKASAHFALGKYSDAAADFKKVLEIHPKDAAARRKLAACQKEARAAAFLMAISGPDGPEVESIDNVDIDSMQVSESYDGPRLESADDLTHEFCLALLDHFRDEKRLPVKYAMRILQMAKDNFSMLGPMMEIPAPPPGSHFTVCGDVHGQFYDLLNIFEINGVPSPTNPYLFNGDFVDRGSFSVEIILTFFAFRALYPKAFFMTRGNHETINMNKMYGFDGEVKAKLNDKMNVYFTQVFNLLPLCAVIGSKVFVVHGGLFNDDGVTLDDIRKIDRNRQPPDSGLMTDMLWSDPWSSQGRGPSKRGCGCTFGPDVTADFLDRNGLTMLVRSHEVKAAGYEVEADGRLVTVFSAPNYCDITGNQGAFIHFDDQMQPTYTSFDAVPHPDVKALAYASPMFAF